MAALFSPGGGERAGSWPQGPGAHGGSPRMGIGAPMCEGGSGSGTAVPADPQMVISIALFLMLF